MGTVTVTMGAGDPPGREFEELDVILSSRGYSVPR